MRNSSEIGKVKESLDQSSQLLLKALESSLEAMGDDPEKDKKILSYWKKTASDIKGKAVQMSVEYDEPRVMKTITRTMIF